MGWCRLFSYFFSAMVSAGILCLIPDRPHPFVEKIGRSTLQIYFWHRLILYCMVYGGVNAWITDRFSWGWRVVYLGIATLIPLILAHPVFLVRLVLWNGGKMQGSICSIELSEKRPEKL